ncbi:MAG: hypothetical protein WAW96_18435 [Alphaproteobacteria bacterium]
MKLKTLTLTGVALGSMIMGLAFSADAAGTGAVGDVTGAVGGVGGAAGGLNGGLSGPVGSASGTIGNQTDVSAPPLSAPSVSTKGAISSSTHPADVGASAGASAKGPAVGISGSTGAQTTAATPNIKAPTVPVASLADPLTDLQHATVQSRDGATIGTINGVKMGPDGKPATINVSLNDAVGGASKISLIPDQLTFDQSNKLVVSSLSQTEINSLAAAQKQTR